MLRQKKFAVYLNWYFKYENRYLALKVVHHLKKPEKFISMITDQSTGIQFNQLPLTKKLL